jgi:hypothetical protein
MAKKMKRRSTRKKSSLRKKSSWRAKSGSYWIQGAIGKHKGLLHKHLGIPKGQKIPLNLLESASKAPGQLGKEARLALTLRGFHRHHR